MKNYNRRDFLKHSALASAGMITLGNSGLPFLTEKESDDIITALQQKAPAHWIWANKNVGEPDKMGQFRLSFDWDGKQEIFWLGFADSTYTIWCNGKPLGIGPIMSVDAWPRLSFWDLTETAQKGKNVLALQVWTHGGKADVGDVSSLEAGVFGWLSKGKETIATSSQWKSRIAEGYVHTHPDVMYRSFTEHRLITIDFRDEPMSWMEFGFDDSGWQPATEVHPFQHPQRKGYRISEIPNLTCHELPAAKIIDAGWATGDLPVVYDEDIAKRLVAQEHQSLLREDIELSYPFHKSKGEPIAQAKSLPKPEKLNWSSLNCPVGIPSPGANREFYLTFDLGQQTSGCLLLELDARAICTIDVGYGDQLIKGRIQPTLQHSLADRAIVNAGHNKFRFPHDRGCRYLQINLTSAANLQKVSWEEHIFPHPETLSFKSSDKALTAIWAAADRTIRQTSLWFYVDNARRERQAWNGTEIINIARGGFALVGDLALTKKHLQDSLDDAVTANGLIPAKVLGNTPESWLRAFDGHDLCFPQACWEYVLHSDDREFAEPLTNACRRLIDYHGERLPNGLKPKIGAWAWNEWNLNAGSNVVTSHNLLLVESLLAMAKLYDYLGNNSEADKMRNEKQKLTTAIFRELMYAKEEVLCQGYDKDGNKVPFCSQFDNALALYLDIVPEDKKARLHDFCSGSSGIWPTNRSGYQGASIGEEVRHRPEQMVVAGTPHGSLIAAKAINYCESPQAAIDYLRFNFGAIIDEGFGTLWEIWAFNRERQHSTCASQGWGTAVAYYILQIGLGAVITQPGGKEISWQPLRINTRQLSGTISTIFGNVLLGWQDDQLNWNVPENVKVNVKLPDGEEFSIQGPSVQQL